jgi:hypothetical protein
MYVAEFCADSVLDIAGQALFVRACVREAGRRCMQAAERHWISQSSTCMALSVLWIL